MSHACSQCVFVALTFSAMDDSHMLKNIKHKTLHPEHSGSSRKSGEKKQTVTLVAFLSGSFLSAFCLLPYRINCALNVSTGSIVVQKVTQVHPWCPDWNGKQP